MSWPEDVDAESDSEMSLLSRCLLDEKPRAAPQRATSEVNQNQKRQSHGLLYALNILWTVALVLATGFHLVPSERPPAANDSLRKVSVPSPLFEFVDLSPSQRIISGSLHDDGSIFRQKPSLEVDEAWYNIALHEAQLINVTAADILASGKDPTKRVRWSDDEDSFPAQVEFSHKIHCLNEIRKEIWGEHYFGPYSIHADDEDHGDGADDNLQAERRKHRQHAMHCLHILLQDLTCNVDVGIITHEWIEVPGRPDDDLVPMADFGTAKQCRDYDAAADWVKSRAVEDGLERFAQLRNGNHQMASESKDNYW